MSLPLNKACDLGDFADPELAALIREVLPHDAARFGPSFPRGREYRKHWEIAMAVRSMRAAGKLHPGAEVLGVGAGNEPTIFYLTTQVRRVFATDLYLAPGWEESASAQMMTDPGRYWPGVWEPRRLVVQHMNALELQHPDDSFDAVFSSSSLEHFGDLEAVRRSLSEMRRVLKPGGLLSISTEYRVGGPGPGMPGVLMFDAEELAGLIAAGGWEPLDGLDLSVGPATLRAPLRFNDALADLARHTKAHGGDILFHKLDWSRYPHILLEHEGRTWTSVHLALLKP